VDTLTALGSDQQGTQGPWDGYAPEGERPPLGSRLALASGFVAAFGAFLVACRRGGRELPERIDARDLALLSGASFKLGRMIAKEKVSAPIRAPFTEYQGKAEAPGEVNERPRGSGPQAAVGELLTCPYCLGMWVISALTVGLVTAPRETRLVASILSALGISDFLQVAYRALVARGGS
jgi:hypothetical protein